MKKKVRCSIMVFNFSFPKMGCSNATVLTTVMLQGIDMGKCTCSQSASTVWNSIALQI